MNKFKFESLNQRLIVAADMEFENGENPKHVALAFLRKIGKEIGHLGIRIKINVIARVLGVTALEYLHDHGLSCFLDLKGFDIEETLKNDASWIQYYEPAMLTVCERVRPGQIGAIQEMLPDTLVLPVGPLTDLTDDDFRLFGEVDRNNAVVNFFNRQWQQKARGVVCSPKDIRLMPEGFRNNTTVITHAKPVWSLPDNNTANALTPTEAFEAGADAIFVGRGITNAPGMTMREATECILEEMQKVLGARR